MTNLVYGFLEVKNAVDRSEFYNLIQSKVSIGFEQIKAYQLIGFPEHFFYEYNENCLCFILGDKPGKRSVPNLLNFMDFADDAMVDYPKKATDQVNFLTQSLQIIVSSIETKRFVVALTDSCEIEETKIIGLQSLSKEILSDVKSFQGPPGIIHDINFDSAY